MHEEQQGVPPKRAVWVDAARCVAMFFILWLHGNAAPGCISEPVGGAICLFFVFAGYFMPQQAGRCALRAGKLALAWLLWSLISWGLYLLVKPDLTWTWERVFGWGEAAYNTPLWFLKDLFIYQLVFSALMVLRILPRYRWFWLVLLAGLAYRCGVGQHESLRFDWMMAVALGFALRGIPLEDLRSFMQRHALPLLLLAGIWFAQWRFYPDFLRGLGMGSYRCGLPLAPLAWMLIFCLAAIAVERLVPRIARLLARCGACLMFCYAAHSLLYAPIYAYGIHWAANIWAPLLAVPLLTLLYTGLAKLFPRALRLLCAK